MMNLSYIAVAVFAYFVFVFFSESFNPLKTKAGYRRRNWRLARSLALIFFLVSTIALTIALYIELSSLHLIIAAALACVILSLYPIAKYLRVNHKPRIDVTTEPTHYYSPSTCASDKIRRRAKSK